MYIYVYIYIDARMWSFQEKEDLNIDHKYYNPCHVPQSGTHVLPSNHTKIFAFKKVPFQAWGRELTYRMRPDIGWTQFWGL